MRRSFKSTETPSIVAIRMFKSNISLSDFHRRVVAQPRSGSKCASDWWRKSAERGCTDF